MFSFFFKKKNWDVQKRLRFDYALFGKFVNHQNSKLEFGANYSTETQMKERKR